jgi:4-amino-4-deoxy-L-arabinose transferase-like glycosyltransferase
MQPGCSAPASTLARSQRPLPWQLLRASWLGVAILLLTSAPKLAAADTEADQAASMAEAEAAAEAGTMRVTTSSQFAAAMKAGVRHITVEDHLDLRSIPTLTPNTPILFQLRPDTRVIQVPCRVPAQGATALFFSFQAVAYMPSACSRYSQVRTLFSVMRRHASTR